MRSTAQIASTGMLLAIAIAASAHAVDGVREIHQICAAGSGCFAGDTAGFPVQITSRGSYRLTSNLDPPNQNTTLISISAAGVSVDLNGFAIRGTNTFAGAGGACTAAGTGDGVSASATDVSVSNGHVRGMGSNGIVLAGANSRIERVIAEGNCGNGMQVGFGSLVIDGIARLNAGHGIVADQTSRVSNCVSSDNGNSGIRSTSDLGRLTVDGCVANANGIDGVFVGARSLVRGCVANSNFDDGIAALGSSQVMESVTLGNSDRGITVLGSPGSGDSTAVGLDVANGNSGLNVSGGVVTGCNVVGGVASCPP